MPRALVEAPLWRLLWLLLAGTALVLSLAALLAGWWGRRLAGAVRLLAEAGAALGRGEAVPAVASPVREVNRVGDALATASAALVGAHRRMVEVLESIGDAFYALDRGLRLTYANRHALEAWGRSAEEVLGRPLLDVFPRLRGGDVTAPSSARSRAASPRTWRPCRRSSAAGSRSTSTPPRTGSRSTSATSPGSRRWRSGSATWPTTTS